MSSSDQPSADHIPTGDQATPHRNQALYYGLAGFLIVIVSLVFIGYCYLHVRPVRRRPSAVAAAATTSAEMTVDPRVLASMPTFVYLESTSEKPMLECAVCLAEFKDGEKGRVLAPCCHQFHASCVDVWLSMHATCPLCRTTALGAGTPSVELSV